MAIRRFFVEYNCAFVADYMTLKGALDYVSRKKLVNDADNMVRIVDKNGDEYHTITGKKINYSPEVAHDTD